MSTTLIVRPEAEQDIDSAYAWYESRQVGLGDRFLNAVDAGMAGILRAPKVGRLILGKYRRALVRHRFPYVVVYRYDDVSDTVIIHGVFHTSQDPALWQQRLP